jgi:hypothetical protein
MSLPSAAALGSLLTSTDPPASAASSSARPTTWGMGSYPGGVAARTCIPAMAPPSNREWVTLLPSPT